MSRVQRLLDDWLNGSYIPPVIDLIGIELLECKDGAAHLALQTEPRHCNPMGIVHGGILCDLADAAMGVAVAAALQEGETFATVALHVSYFRPVQESRLTAVGKVVSRSRTVGHVECDITDEQGQLVARATSTCVIQTLE